MGNNVSLDGLSDSEEHVINPCGSDDIDEMLEGEWEESYERRKKNRRRSSEERPRSKKSERNERSERSEGSEGKRPVVKCRRSPTKGNEKDKNATEKRQTKKPRDSNAKESFEEDSQGEGKSSPKSCESDQGTGPIPYEEIEAGVFPQGPKGAPGPEVKGGIPGMYPNVPKGVPEQAVKAGSPGVHPQEPKGLPEQAVKAGSPGVHPQEPKGVPVQEVNSEKQAVSEQKSARNSESTDSMLNKLLNEQPRDPFMQRMRRLLTWDKTARGQSAAPAESTQTQPAGQVVTNVEKVQQKVVSGQSDKTSYSAQPESDTRAGQNKQVVQISPQPQEVSPRNNADNAANEKKEPVRERRSASKEESSRKSGPGKGRKKEDHTEDVQAPQSGTSLALKSVPSKLDIDEYEVPSRGKRGEPIVVDLPDGEYERQARSEGSERSESSASSDGSRGRSPPMSRRKYKSPSQVTLSSRRGRDEARITREQEYLYSSTTKRSNQVSRSPSARRAEYQSGSPVRHSLTARELDGVPRSSSPRRADYRPRSPASSGRRRRSGRRPSTATSKIEKIRELTETLEEQYAEDKLNEARIADILGSNQVSEQRTPRESEADCVRRATFIYDVARQARDGHGDKRIDYEHILFAVWCLEHKLELTPEQYAAAFKLFTDEMRNE